MLRRSRFSSVGRSIQRLSLIHISMIIKGCFLTWGPAAWRTPLLDWCFAREAIDYRFFGLWLCMLAVLLLHALGLLHR